MLEAEKTHEQWPAGTAGTSGPDLRTVGSWNRQRVGDAGCRARDGGRRTRLWRASHIYV